MADLATQLTWRSSAGQRGCLQKIPGAEEVCNQ